MPRIPTFDQNQISPQPLPTVRKEYLRDTRGESLGNALGNIGDVAHKIQLEERNKADRAAFMEADTQTGELSTRLLTDPQKGARTRVGKDAIGSTDEYLKQYDEESNKILANLKSDRQRTAYSESRMRRREQLSQDLNTHEFRERESYYDATRKSYEKSAFDDAVTNYKDAKRIESQVENITASVAQTPGLNAAQRAQIATAKTSTVYAGVIDRYLANEELKPAEAYYRSVKGKIDGEAATQIENSIRITRDRLESKARSLMDKREAAAVRAVNAIDQQIASGVPATPDMWKQWEQAVKGTEMEAEFKTRSQDEKEVQNVLRKPMQEQIDFLQKKEADLKSEGGSVRQLNNYNRLRTAIQQNIKLLNESPLLFSATRTGEEPSPIDLGDLVSGEAQDEVSDRINTLMAMKKIYGNVPMKVLLPQEAAQLNSALQTATPKRQAQVFGGLYKSLGPEAYRVAMQQVAADSPVRAMAGMLTAKEAQMTTAEHWFKPNDMVGSGDVAETLLQGEDLLNATKTDKAQDGKPKVSLYLPESTTLQGEFFDQVGEVFAGRPAAADIAFQAVKSYYVGRAAQIGRLAADGKDIDTKLVKEAITATMGEVVDYNGADVMAPWGMNSADFKDRVSKSLNARLGEDAGRVTLKNAGDGTYYVTQGKNFVVDKNGQPIVIDVSKAPQGASGGW